MSFPGRMSISAHMKQVTALGLCFFGRESPVSSSLLNTIHTAISCLLFIHSSLPLFLWFVSYQTALQFLDWRSSLERCKTVGNWYLSFVLGFTKISSVVMNLPLFRILLSTSVKGESWSRLVIRGLPAMILLSAFSFSWPCISSCFQAFVYWGSHWYLRFVIRATPHIEASEVCYSPHCQNQGTKEWATRELPQGRRGGNTAAESLMLKC